MAIRNRRGNSQQFDKSRLLSGEFAYVLDTGELFYCYGANQVKKLATEEDLQSILDASSSSYTALLQLIEDLESNPSEITNILNSISDLEDEDIAIYQSISELELKFDSAILLENKSVYISPTGSDATGNGSSGSPYKTFSKALSVIPKNLNGFSANVYVANGKYTENITIKGFHGGRFYITLTASGSVTLNGYFYIETTSDLLFNGTDSNLIINTTNTTGGLYINSNSSVISNKVFITVNGTNTTNGVLVNGYSGFYTDRAITINNCFAGIRSVVNSSFYASTISGSGNINGLFIDSGASVSYGTKTISATTEKVLTGGAIITNDLNTYLKNRYTESLSELQIAENTFQVTIRYNSGLPVGVWTTIATFNPTTYKNTRIDFGNSYMFNSEGFMIAIDSANGTAGMVRLNYTTGELQGYSKTLVGLIPIVRVIYNK